MVNSTPDHRSTQPISWRRVLQPEQVVNSRGTPAKMRTTQSTRVPSASTRRIPCVRRYSTGRDPGVSASSAVFPARHPDGRTDVSRATTGWALAPVHKCASPPHQGPLHPRPLGVGRRAPAAARRARVAEGRAIIPAVGGRVHGQRGPPESPHGDDHDARTRGMTTRTA